MGAAVERFPRVSPPLADDERARLVRQLLADGTVSRLRDLAGWSAGRLAFSMDVAADMVTAWESGVLEPDEGQAVKLWPILVLLCRLPTTTP